MCELIREPQLPRVLCLPLNGVDLQVLFLAGDHQKTMLFFKSFRCLFKKSDQIWSAAAAVDQVRGRVVVFRVVVGGDGARVVVAKVGVIVAGRILRQNFNQLRQEVVRLQETDLKILKQKKI